MYGGGAKTGGSSIDFDIRLYYSGFVGAKNAEILLFLLMLIMMEFFLMKQLQVVLWFQVQLI